jgi:hypothetical protein
MDYLTAVAGAGTLIFSGPGWAVGGRAYALDWTHKFRPHFTATYGTTAVWTLLAAKDDPSTSVADGVLNGLGLFLGLDHDLGAPGGFIATYGVGYITHEELPAHAKALFAENGDSDPDLGAPIKIMLGIGYQFSGNEPVRPLVSSPPSRPTTQAQASEDTGNEPETH